MEAPKTVKPRLPAMLAFDELDALHWSALRVLEEVGLHVADEACLAKLDAHPSITRRGNRLHFKADFVHEEVAKHRKRTRPPVLDETTEPTLSVGGHATHYVDVDSDEPRLLDREAAVSITRSVDGLHSRGLRGGCPGPPQDIAPGLREVAQAYIGWTNSRCGGYASPSTPQAAEFVFEMNQVMGRPCGIGIHVLSPLRLEGNEFDLAVRYSQSDRFGPIGISVGSMPIMGVTAPIHPAGAFVVSVAEILGGWIAIRLYLERDDVGFCFDAYSADMRTGGFIYGNPEQKLVDLIKRDVNAFYHTQKLPRSMYTMAHRPGAQSCAEMAALATVDALCGFKTLLGTQMALDELCSVEQYVLALEMMRSAMRIADGVRWDRTALGVDAIRDICGQAAGTAAGGGNFMVHDSTLQSYRDVYWLPDLWDRHTLAARTWEDTEPARVRAKEIAREAPGWSDFELEEEKAKGLAEVWRKAEEAFGAK